MGRMSISGRVAAGPAFGVPAFGAFAFGLAALAATLVAPVSASAQAARDLTVVTKPERPRPRPEAGGGGSGVSGPVTVSLVPSGSPVIRIGDPIRFKVVSTHAGFGHVYVMSASGRVQLWAENLRLQAGVPVDLPRRGLAIVAAPPAGDETVLFVATRKRFQGFLGGSTTANPAELQITRDSLLPTLQGKLGVFPREHWGFAQLVIRVTE
ncbi:DUF4384 domain-containing protein [Prosthecomicrobium hirschii]|uniref:DUF4384 domain-containing protein n=1 Tax=Prosthecodimorpha hirschii TaxID=665126 RepID=UPI0009F8AA87|nr:DUF4384 domain-containing protein [Prosthecomicrobium hirschii]MCW1841037.1 DUF4384 domain-containing protein [Prosthecomicrobium hirschii]